MTGVMQRPLRIGLAGAGWVSAHHLAGWKQLPEIELVAICDPDIAKARDRAQAYGIARVYADAASMFDAEQLDAIDIATPMHTHAALCRLAADHGVHILCQKPLAPSWGEARQLVDDIGTRVHFMVHENWRFRPQYRQVKAWVDAGAVGDIRYCRLATRSSGLLPDASGHCPALQRQPFLASLARLIVGEALVHHLDVVTWLMGPMRLERAKLARGLPGLQGEHAATLLLAGEEGRWALVEGDFAAAGQPPSQLDSLELIGTLGSIRFEGEHLALLSAQPQQATIDLAAGYSSSYAQAIAHFVQGLRDGSPFETAAADHLAVLVLVEAAYSSAA